MIEKLPGIGQFKKHAPEIEAGIGAGGLIGMAGVAANPDRALEISKVSPVGLETAVDLGSKVGLSEHAVFAIVTTYFGFALAHGIYMYSRRRLNNNQGQ